MANDLAMLLGGLGFLAGVTMAVMVFALIIGIAVYVFFALSLMNVAKKTKTPNAWFAWIPILNILLMLNIAKLPWWYIFYLLLPLIPFIGYIAALAVFMYIFWKVAEAVNKPGWYALLTLIPIVGIFISWYLIAWQK